MRRLRRWLCGSRSWKRRITSFIRRVAGSITTAGLAGKRPDVRAGSGNFYSLYDTCDKCPLRAYIDLVCNDNPRALVIEGNPPAEVLEAVRIALVNEFAELSGNGHTSAVNLCVGRMNLYRARITGLSLCLFLIGCGRTEEVVPFLAGTGIRAKASDKGLAGKIEAGIRSNRIRLKEELKRYRGLVSKEEGGERPTPGLFTDQLVSLSRHAGFRLTNEITLAEYAAYLKDMKQELESLKKINYGKYHK